MDTEDLLRKRLGEGRFRQIERAIKSQKLLDTAPRAAQYQGFQINSGAIIRSVGDGVRSVTPISNGLVAPGDGVRIVGWSANWKPRVEAPVEEEIKEEEYYPFKVLFSVKEPDPNDKTKEVLAFYLGGDRRAPKRLINVESNAVVIFAALHNYGKNFKGSICLQTSTERQMFNITEKKVIQVTRESNLSFFSLINPFFYIGDGKYNCSFEHPIFTSEATTSGEHCNTTTNAVYTCLSPAPLSLSGYAKSVYTGGDDEYCELSTFQENSIKNINSVNLYIDSLEPVKVSVCSSTYKTSINWAKGGDVVSIGTYSFGGNIANNIGSQLFQYDNGYRWQGSGLSRSSETGTAFESFNLSYPFFVGKDNFFQHKISAKFDVRRDDSTWRVFDKTRPIYNHAIVLKSKNDVSAEQTIYEEWKGLLFISETKINLKEDSTHVTLKCFNIDDKNNYSIASYLYFGQNIERFNLFIKNFINSKVIVNQNQYSAEGIIERIDYKLARYSDFYFSLTGDFSITVRIEKTTKKKFVSFTNENGLLYTSNNSLQDFVIRNLCFKSQSDVKLSIIFSDAEINMFTGFSLYYLRYNAAFSVAQDYGGSNIDRVSTYFYREFNSIINNSCFVKNKIYYPPIDLAISYNLYALDFGYFENIKNKDNEKYCDVWEISKEGKIIQKEPEKGFCLSLKRPNCTIHAVSYCPVPNP